MRWLIRRLRALFGWRFLYRRGAWTYTENVVTGQRSAHQALFLNGPLDADTIRVGDIIWWRDGRVEQVEELTLDAFGLRNLRRPRWAGGA